MSLKLLARKRAALFVGALCLGSSIPLMAGETVEEIASRYGIRESVRSISLSPSGTKIAFVGAGPRHTETRSVIDLAGDKKPKTILTNTEINTNLAYCEWASDERLVCEASMILRNNSKNLVGFSRIFSIGSDGSKPFALSPESTPRDARTRQDGGDIVALDEPSGDNRVLMTKRGYE